MEIPGLHMLQRHEVKALLEPEDWERLQEFSWQGLKFGQASVLFVQLESGIWEGHWFGTEARESLRACKKALAWLAKEDPGCEVRGVTPCENLKA